MFLPPRLMGMRPIRRGEGTGAGRGGKREGEGEEDRVITLLGPAQPKKSSVVPAD
jgi:hypothetical protein